MTEACKYLHEIVQSLPEVRWPFATDHLPRNGIYFFSEEGEYWGHGGDVARVVRVGTHREGNFRSRMADHFILSERKMEFTSKRAAPKDRSIFRKNIGRALLNRDKDPYLAVWEIDFTTRAVRESMSVRRDVEKERLTEREVTRNLRERFSFRWIEVEGQEQRMGSEGLEAALIGTLSACRECRPGAGWLGQFSPKPKITQSGLWLEQHLNAPSLSVDSLARVAQEFFRSEKRSGDGTLDG